MTKSIRSIYGKCSAFLYHNRIAVMAILLATILLVNPCVFAETGEELGRRMINFVLTIICNMVSIVGLIFVIVGGAKYGIAHANDQGPDQTRAIMMVATGVVLTILPQILMRIDFASMFTLYYVD